MWFNIDQCAAVHHLELEIHSCHAKENLFLNHHHLNQLPDLAIHILAEIIQSAKKKEMWQYANASQTTMETQD